MLCSQSGLPGAEESEAEVNFYYVMARESGKFSVEEIKKIAYLANLNRNTVEIWFRKRRTQWSVYLAA